MQIIFRAQTLIHSILLGMTRSPWAKSLIQGNAKMIMAALF